jgi:hypothetical protein
VVHALNTWRHYLYG